MFVYVALCLVFITCITNGKSVLGHLDKNDNVKCQAFPSVVPVNRHGLPHFVTLYRCQGGDYSLQDRRCVNRTMTLVKVKVLSPSGVLDIQMVNHTSCGEECIYAEPCPKDLFDRDESDCSCKCKHSTAPKGKECPPDTTWSKQDCKCKCNLKQEGAPRRKVLDKEKCRFACAPCPQGYHAVEPRCRCVPNQQTVGGRKGSDNSNQGKMLAALVIGEFLFLYLIFDFLLYSKKTGLMYFIKGKCSSKSQPEQPPQGSQVESEKRCLATPDESNYEQVTVCVHSNGNAKPTSHALHTSSL